jgi:hypothetical protein
MGEISSDQVYNWDAKASFTSGVFSTPTGVGKSGDSVNPHVSPNPDTFHHFPILPVYFDFWDLEGRENWNKVAIKIETLRTPHHVRLCTRTGTSWQ